MTEWIDFERQLLSRDFKRPGPFQHRYFQIEHRNHRFSTKVKKNQFFGVKGYWNNMKILS